MNAYSYLMLMCARGIFAAALLVRHVIRKEQQSTTRQVGGFVEPSVVQRVQYIVQQVSKSPRQVHVTAHVSGQDSH